MQLWDENIVAKKLKVYLVDIYFFCFKILRLVKIKTIYHQMKSI